MRLGAVSRIDGTSPYALSALAVALENSKVLSSLDQRNAFMRVATDSTHRVANQGANFQTRARNGVFTSTAIAPQTPQPITLKFHGDKLHVDPTDVADAEDRNTDIGTHLQERVSEMIRNVVEAYDGQALVGDGSTTTLQGIFDIHDGTNLPGFSQSNVYGAETFNAALAGDTSKHFDLRETGNYLHFLSMLEQQLLEVKGCNAIYLPQRVEGIITTIGREKQLISTVNDEIYGPVTTFRGIPLIGFDTDALPLTESNADDSATDTCSIMLLNLGEGNVELVTNSGIEWEDYREGSKDADGYRIEIRSAWRIKKRNVSRKIQHIKI